MVYRKQSLALAALVALISTPLAADVKRGVDAWSAGDFSEAVDEWRLPAQQGNADAMFNLGQAYRLGRGVPEDVAKATELYAEAARRGHVKAADNYGLLLFQQGKQEEAMPLIRSASERGDPRAHYVLGLAHFNGDFAEKDWTRAYALLTLSYGAGLPQAGDALRQMDTYIPMAERQKAQLVAREIEVEAGKRRAAQLASNDLKVGQTNVPATARATAMATATPTPRFASTPAGSNVIPPPAPAPVPAPAPNRVAQVAAKPSVQPVQRVASAPPSVPASARPLSAPQPTAKTGAWGVQLGAFGVPDNANRLWGKLAANPALAGTRKALVPGGGVTRLRAVGFVSRSAAAQACSQLKAQGQACFVAKPSA